LEVIPQRYCVVVLYVAGAVNQFNGTPPRGFYEGLPSPGVGIELGKVSSPKLLPFRWIMPEPAAQGMAWGDVFQPAIKMQGGFLHTPRPQPLDEKTRTFRFASWTVNSS
jgi:hypothetical protein